MSDFLKPVIKEAELSDLREILELQYLAYQSEAKLFNDPDIPPLKQTLSDLESEFRKGVILKASDENNVIVGSVRGHCDNKTLYIGKLMVHPDRQRQGVGTRLLLDIEKRYPGYRYELFTSTRSEKNIALYKRLGYSIFDEKRVTEELSFVYLEKH